MIAVEFSLTESEYVDASRNALPWQQRGLALGLGMLVLCAIPLLAMTALGLVHWTPQDLVNFAVPLVLFAGFFIYGRTAHSRSFRRRRAQFEGQQWNFGDEKITARLRSSESTLTWETYSRFTETPDCILLWYRHQRIFNIIPKRILEERSLLEEFRALLKARIKS